MNHFQLLRIAKTLGYETNDVGMCHGFSSMWMQAVCAGDLKTFDERLKFLEKFPDPRVLKAEIDKARTNWRLGKENLTSYEEMLLEIPAFFEGITVYHNPPQELFDKQLQQFHELEIATVMQSRLLEGSGGLAQAFNATDSYNQSQLTSYLQAMSQQLRERPDAAILFSANKHTVGVRVVGNNQFQLIDTDNLSEYNKVFTSQQLAKKLDETCFGNNNLFSWFTGIKPLLLSTSIFTNKNNPVNVDNLLSNTPINVLTPNQQGVTVLHEAATNNDLNLLKRMDFSKIDVNRPDSSSRTAFAIACFTGNTDVVDYLLQDKDSSSRLNVNKTSFGTTPIHMAFQFQHYDIVDKILDLPGFDPKASSSSGTLFHIIALKPDDIRLAYVPKLIAKGIDINGVDSSGSSALYQACIQGNNNAIELFLANGADPTGQNSLLKPLVGAALSGNSDVVDMLISQGANCNQANRASETALHAVSKKGDSAVVEKLLSHSADCNIRTTNGMTPLIMACTEGHAHLIPKLLPKTTLSMEDIDVNSPLSKLISRCEMDVQIQFLKKALQVHLNQQVENSFNWGFLKNDSRGAANALLAKLDDNTVSLRDHHGTLTNGRLSSLYHLYEAIETKRQRSSSAVMLTQLENSKKGSSTLLPSNSLGVALESPDVNNNNISDPAFDVESDGEHCKSPSVTPLKTTPL